MARKTSSLYAVMILGTVLLAAGLLAAPGIGIYKLPLTTALPVRLDGGGLRLATGGTYFDHTVIIVMENEGIQDICRQNPPPCQTTVAPFLAGLANNYTIAQQYTSIASPLTSFPNYIGLIGGSTFSCTGGGCGGLGAVTAPNLVDRVEKAGLSWKGYFENYPVASGCQGAGNSQGTYNNIHNPFIWFNDIYNNATRCSKLVTANPSSCPLLASGYNQDCQLISDLNAPGAPNLAWLTPNDCDNMHGSGPCSTGLVAAGDAYLRSIVPAILGSAAFTTGRGALFITFDEGNGFCPLNGGSSDCVYAGWSGSQAQKARSSSTAYNHYSWLATIEKNWGLSSLQTNDAAAQPMTEYLTAGVVGPGPLQVVFTFSPINPVINSPVTFSASFSGGTQPYGISWTFSAGSTATVVGSTQFSITLIFSVAGTYTATVFGYDSSLPQQTTTASAPITINNPTTALDAIISINPQTTTVGTAVTFTSTISGGQSPYTVNWNFGDGLADTNPTTTHSYTTTGNFTVTLEVSDSANPVNTVSRTSWILVNPPPCTGSCTQLAASFSWSPTIPSTNQQLTFAATATGGAPPYGFSWVISGGACSGSCGSGSGNPFSFTIGSPGTYTVTLTVVDSAARQTSVTNQVTVQAPSGSGSGSSSGIPLWAILTTAGLILAVAPVGLLARPRRKTG